MAFIQYQEIKFKPASLRLISIARDICAEYAEAGYDLTLRQLYYQFVARGYIPNKQTEYKRLGSIINDARLAGLIDWDHLVDRTRNLQDLAHWSSPEQIIRAVARQFRLEKWATQPTRVEVWVEKEALAGVVGGVCVGLDVPYFSCRGYVSQSEMWAAAQRVQGYLTNGHTEKVVILHLGDHDPSGIDMTRDIRERLEMFLGKDHSRETIGPFLHGMAALHGVGGLEYDEWPDDAKNDAQEQWADLRRNEGWHRRLEIRRIALNADQIEEYNPPPNPTKITDSRANAYIDEFGYESWELDALPPDVLGRLIEDHVLGERDIDRWEDVALDEDEHKRLLSAVSDNWASITADL